MNSLVKKVSKTRFRKKNRCKVLKIAVLVKIRFPVPASRDTISSLKILSVNKFICLQAEAETSPKGRMNAYLLLKNSVSFQCLTYQIRNVSWFRLGCYAHHVYSQEALRPEKMIDMHA